MKKLLLIAAALLGMTTAAKMQANAQGDENSALLSGNSALTLALVTLMPVIFYLMLLLW